MLILIFCGEYFLPFFDEYNSIVVCTVKIKNLYSKNTILEIWTAN